MTSASGAATVEVLRTAALEVFAEQGLDATVRQIATRAGLSHGLIRHHFGSRDGLREAVDEHVIARVIEVFGLGPDERSDEAAARRQERVVRFAHEEPAVARYMGRLMTADPHVGQPLFDAMAYGLQRELEDRAAAGEAWPHDDTRVLAVQVILLELGALALRPLVEAHLGFSLSSEEGAQRWASTAFSLLNHGVYRPAE